MTSKPESPRGRATTPAERASRLERTLAALASAGPLSPEGLAKALGACVRTVARDLVQLAAESRIARERRGLYCASPSGRTRNGHETDSGRTTNGHAPRARQVSSSTADPLSPSLVESNTAAAAAPFLEQQNGHATDSEQTRNGQRTDTERAVVALSRAVAELAAEVARLGRENEALRAPGSAKAKDLSEEPPVRNDELRDGEARIRRVVEARARELGDSARTKGGFMRYLTHTLRRQVRAGNLDELEAHEKADGVRQSTPEREVLTGYAPSGHPSYELESVAKAKGYPILGYRK